MRNRIQEIKNSFGGQTEKRNLTINSNKMNSNYYEGHTGYQPPSDFNKIRIGAKVLEDAVLNLGTYSKINPRLADKHNVLRAITNYDLKTMREVSDFFYKTNGIYARILRYMAFMYRYDWFVTPYIVDKKAKSDKVEDGFYKCLKFFDDYEIKKTFGEISLKILRQGAYYGYRVETADGEVLQELPVNYCRSRFNYGNKPAVEFNMKFFDETFRDTTQRMRMLKMFPSEFKKGYELYKQQKLLPDFMGDENGWYLLDPKNAVKFTVNGEDYPAFIAIIPLLIDLDEAQGLDRKKTLQRLLKIVVQKMPLDKNGDPIFDIEEAQQFHNNAVGMLSRAIGVDVLTTFAEVNVENLSDTNAASSQADDLERVERQVYNEAGVSQNQFNATGNLALTNSLLNDEATMYNMLLQFECFLNEVIKKFNTQPKKYYYKLQFLTTTIYNYKELSKLYKEQTQLGYSKMLPQIALGQLQSSILANSHFENDILDLVNVFVPPMMSSTMNADSARILQGKTEEVKAGRKEKPDTEKTAKTIANRESMN